VISVPIAETQRELANIGVAYDDTGLFGIREWVVGRGGSIAAFHARQAGRRRGGSVTLRRQMTGLRGIAVEDYDRPLATLQFNGARTNPLDIAPVAGFEDAVSLPARSLSY
jgi:hypothetical protein